MINTDAYLLLGLGVAFTVMGLLLSSLVLRFRQTHSMIETLKTLSDK
jgi:hypothetical protein